MCKYCNETLYLFEHKRFVTKEEMYDPIDKKFCAHCGAPLGEVKPLTVEQLRQMDGKPVFVVWIGRAINCWCIIKIYNYAEEDSGAYLPGNDDFYFLMKEYGTTWTAFDREPKE